MKVVLERIAESSEGIERCLRMIVCGGRRTICSGGRRRSPTKIRQEVLARTVADPPGKNKKMGWGPDLRP